MPKGLDLGQLGVEPPDDVATAGNCISLILYKACIINFLSGVGRDAPIRVVLRVYLSYSSSAKAATNVSLSISAPSFITVVPSNIHLQQVSGAQSTPIIVHVTLLANKSFLPTCLDINVTGSYNGPLGDPRVINQAHKLPLAVACKLRTAQKNAAHKITVETVSQEAVALTELFGDFLISQQAIGIDAEDVLGANGGIAMGFQYWCSDRAILGGSAVENPVIVSIISSKNGGRYRVQSDHFPALAVIVKELDIRLQNRLRDQNKKDRCTQLSEALPFDAYFHTIGDHFRSRKNLNELLSQLNDTSHQFRMVEKRLLVRFRDRNPSALGGLDNIMKDSYLTLVRLADEVQEIQGLLLRQRECLDASSRLIACLAGMKFNMTEEATVVLHQHLFASGYENVDQGWEDTVDASSTYLLKTSLAKNVKDSAIMQPNIETIDNVDKLIKHIAMVFDRLSKGGQLTKSLSATPHQTESSESKR
jgi:Bardet-Biedl syndrome 9 protein